MTQAVLLMNLGTPAEPTAKGLRDFYKYFFSDPYVFDFNPVGRWLLRNLIILPFRAPRIAKDYAEIWMDKGSPLKVYADEMEASIQQAFDAQGGNVLVRTGMAYSKPFVWDAMAELEAAGATEILLLPMFPQYSTATTASVFNSVEKAARRWKKPPKLHFVDDLFQEPAFLKAWASLLNKHVDISALDHVIFSYHGVPEKTIKKADAANVCQFGNCCESVTDSNKLCYRMQCIQTTRGITSELGWDADKFSVAFQSRFGPLPWIQPYLDDHIEALVVSYTLHRPEVDAVDVKLQVEDALKKLGTRTKLEDLKHAAHEYSEKAERSYLFPVSSFNLTFEPSLRTRVTGQTMTLFVVAANKPAIDEEEDMM